MSRSPEKKDKRHKKPKRRIFLDAVSVMIDTGVAIPLIEADVITREARPIWPAPFKKIKPNALHLYRFAWLPDLEPIQKSLAKPAASAVG